MTNYQRYAIYWTPEPGTGFAAFGERLFGAGGDTFGLPEGLKARAIEAPARYRLHATLKAPFRLGDGVSVAGLQADLDRFCSRRRVPSGGALRLAQFQRYLGLVLSRDAAAIDWLAEECVTHFDRFRAPFDESDRERRDLDRHTETERGLTESFGYPYVLSAFRFHISLAGPLSRPELNEVSAALEPEVAPFMREPFRIESLSLLGEPEGGGVFELLSRHRFGYIPRF